MIIGVDMDSVLAEFLSPLDAFHNRVYKTNITYSDHTNYDLRVYWGCSLEEMFERMFAFYNSAEFLTIPPIGSSQIVLKELGRKHSLHLITSRPHSIEKQSLAWLDKYYPQMFNSIHHTNQISEKGFGKGVKKSAICAQIHADIMIDDHIENVYDCADHMIKTLMFPAPWNLSFEANHPYIQKVSGWDEIASILA